MLNLNIEAILKLMFFQDTATPTMSGIIDLHQHVFFFIIFIFIVVVFQIFNVFLFFKKIVKNPKFFNFGRKKILFFENANMGNGGEGDDNENWLKKLYKKIKAKMVKFYNDHSTAIYITLGVLFITGLSIGLCYYFQINPIEYLFNRKWFYYRNTIVQKFDNPSQSIEYLKQHKINVVGEKSFMGPDKNVYDQFITHKRLVCLDFVTKNDKSTVETISNFFTQTHAEVSRYFIRYYASINKDFDVTTLDEAGINLLVTKIMETEMPGKVFDYTTEPFFNNFPQELQEFLIKYAVEKGTTKMSYTLVQQIIDNTFQLFTYLNNEEAKGLYGDTIREGTKGIIYRFVSGKEVFFLWKFFK